MMHYVERSDINCGLCAFAGSTGSSQKRECRRFPPTALLQGNNLKTRYPEVSVTHRPCGEFAPKAGWDDPLHSEN